ncbi:MAG: PfaD family polyunsaturated fatty acid/polyketide biosynthesis protein [Anaerolineales bacterium]|nr:PfaD family polyunsaturated fatty acid/polyketide biosynthesis protein [Anaerolineales bacterium]MCB8952639.1 PfaD family polyunsaturated fatty acid/polyketide biosynthesis protein [Ardenticatenales bacterium]
MTQNDNGLRYFGAASAYSWHGSANSIAFDPVAIKATLLDVNTPCYVVRDQYGRIGVTREGYFQSASAAPSGIEGLTVLAPMPVYQLGDPFFRAFHQVQYAYATGAMANGIASEALVIAMGQAGFLGSFGAAGLMPDRVEQAIQSIQQALPGGPYAFNLIHSPQEEDIERAAVDLYLRHNVATVEASAFMDLTPNVVYYRVAGLGVAPEGYITVRNKIIAKISRREVAEKFLKPAPPRLLNQLVSAGLITQQQASLAEHVPMADDITVEADSGGHTDNQSLVCLFPSITLLRDEIQSQSAYQTRIGAAGGIGTPTAALAAFMMGASYVVTGSVNQSCLEAGVSPHTKALLAQAAVPDVAMAPAADMFEMGVQVQVLKKGTFFPMRAQKLYSVYRAYDSIEAIPAAERQQLESQIFQRNLDDVWADTAAFFQKRDPSQLEKANRDPKRKMALVFRWYLGLSSRWSNTGVPDRTYDYQIWCGPAMGSFNDWVRGSYLEPPENRRAVEVAQHIMLGAAYLYRLHQAGLGGVMMPAFYRQYIPTPFA